MVEKDLIDDSTLPITIYNYSAIRDRLARRDIRIALSTIIDRAKGLGCYQLRKATLIELFLVLSASSQQRQHWLTLVRALSPQQ